ncbi:leucyl aminopeptidase family protein [Haliea sp.]
MTTLYRFITGLALTLVAAVAAADYVDTTHAFREQPASEPDTLVVLVPLNSTDGLPEWGEATREHFSRALAAQDFDGSMTQQLEILAPVGLPVDRLIAVGLGEAAELARADAEIMGASLANYLNLGKAGSVQVQSALIPDPRLNTAIVSAIAHGVDLVNYRFDRFKTEAEPRPTQSYEWLVADQEQAGRAWDQLNALAQGVFTARELTNLSASDGNPAAFAEYVRQRLQPLGVKVTILGPQQVLKAGMGALYGVSKGSQHGAHLLIAHWRGSDDPPVALVGKGITFDSGGYNLKTDAASILAMTGDKAGAAAVAGTLEALARQKAAFNVVGIMPLAQNAISGTAQLPGDVVTAGNGMTIEIVNTDAEGRLVLADGIWYAREHFQPQVIADIATLTGSKVRALGRDYAAVFSEEEELIETLKTAGELTRERVWQLPLGPYEKIIDSTIADMKNSGQPGAQAGAVFLQRFAGDTPWIHIDMAGNGRYEDTSQPPLIGATGYGVRLLTEWVKLYAE